MYRLVVIFGLLALGCDRTPREVYIPAGKQSAEVTISASASVIEAGEALVLHATRRNIGEWQRIEREDLPEGACWMVSPPPSFEPAVADNIGWKVEPEGFASFNLDLRRDHTRTVVFSQAGEYRLSARSSVWCGEKVDAQPRVIVITVKGAD